MAIHRAYLRAKFQQTSPNALIIRGIFFVELRHENNRGNFKYFSTIRLRFEAFENALDYGVDGSRVELRSKIITPIEQRQNLLVDDANIG